MLDSVAKQNPDLKADGYTILGIVFIVTAVSLWFAPSFIAVTGPRITLVLFSLAYIIYLLCFIHPITWLLYTVSVVVGLGESFIWVAEGVFIARCSNTSNASLYATIFWTLYSSSSLFGNIVVIFLFKSKVEIDSPTRHTVVGILAIIAVVGSVILACLRYVPDNSDVVHSDSNLVSAWIAFKDAFRLFITKEMLLLSVSFTYVGILLTFYTSVYGPSVGFTQNLHETPKQIVGEIGILVGVGELLGGLACGTLNWKAKFVGRCSIVTIGYVLHMVAFVLVFLNIPDKANLGDTWDNSVFNPPIHWIALFCAFLLGVGDLFINTQIMALLADDYVSQSASAFALYNFFFALGSSLGAFYSAYVGIRGQVATMVVFATIGVPFFCIVERYWLKKRRQQKQDEDENN